MRFWGRNYIIRQRNFKTGFNAPGQVWRHAFSKLMLKKKDKIMLCTLFWTKMSGKYPR